MRDEIPCRPGSGLVQKSFEHISASDVFYETDERESRCIGEISREVNLMYWLRIGHVSTTCGRKMWKINPKILMDERSWKKIVMDEE